MSNRPKEHLLADLDSPVVELTTGEAERVTGGVAAGDVTADDVVQDAAVTDTIVSPRDPASGLPTGKRTHKPFNLGG